MAAQKLLNFNTDCYGERQMRDALVGAFLEYINDARLSLLKKAHEFMKFLSVDNI